MSHLTEPWYQTSDVAFEIAHDDWQRANDRTGDPPAKAADVLSLEEFAFSLLNQLADDYGIYEDGSISRAIWVANTPEEMNPIIAQLQTQLLVAMKSVAGM